MTIHEPTLPFRRSIALASLAAATLLAWAPPGLAQGAASGAPAAANDPAVVARLDAMGVYLRSLKKFVVKAQSSKDEVLVDVYGYRATRFGNYYSDFNYAAERTVESVKYYYRLKFPHDEHEHARPYRVSPVHYRLMENGAVFGEKFGWERVNYFDPGNEWRRRCVRAAPSLLLR